MQDFIDENPRLHSVICMNGGELRDAIVEYIERNMLREKLDPDAYFLFDINPTGDTHVAIKRSVRRIDQ